MSAVDLHGAEVLKAQLRQEMEQVHGPLLGGTKLVAALGHANAASLRQARRRGRVPVPLFSLPQRRGFFALTRDVADWLAEARLTAIAPSIPHPSPAKGEPPPEQP
jgi:hypothetical protein